MKLSRGPTNYALLLLDSRILCVLLEQRRNIQMKICEMVHGPNICIRCIRCACPPSQHPQRPVRFQPDHLRPGNRSCRQEWKCSIHSLPPAQPPTPRDRPTYNALFGRRAAPNGRYLGRLFCISPPTYLEKLCAGLTFSGMGLIPLRDHKKLR